MKTTRALADTKRLIGQLHQAGGVIMLVDAPPGMDVEAYGKPLGYLISTDEYAIYERLVVEDQKRRINHNLFPKFTGTPEEVAEKEKRAEEARLKASLPPPVTVSDDEVLAIVADNGRDAADNALSQLTL